MSNDAEVRARAILAHEFSKRGQPSVALAIRRDNLNEDGPYAPAVAAMIAFAAEARSHDGEWEAMKERCAKVAEDFEPTTAQSGDEYLAACEAGADIAQSIRSLSAVPLDEGRG